MWRRPYYSHRSYVERLRSNDPKLQVFNFPDASDGATPWTETEAKEVALALEANQVVNTIIICLRTCPPKAVDYFLPLIESKSLRKVVLNVMDRNFDIHYNALQDAVNKIFIAVHSSSVTAFETVTTILPEARCMFKFLDATTNLHTVKIWFTQGCSNPETFVALEQGFRRNSTLQVLDLRFLSECDRCCSFLLGLCRHPVLRKFSIEFASPEVTKLAETLVEIRDTTPSLQELDVKARGDFGIFFRTMSPRIGLRRLQLTGATLSYCKFLMDYSKHNDTVDTLLLLNCHFENEESIQALSMFQGLKRLDLVGWALRPSILSNLIQTNSNLRHLFLSGTFPDMVFQDLGNMLWGHGLEELTLQNRGLSVDMTYWGIDAVFRCHSITTLALTSFKFGYQTAVSFARGLRYNVTMEHVRLCVCVFDVDDVLAILSAAGAHPSLKTLDMSGFNTSNCFVGEAMLQAVRSSSSLYHIKPDNGAIKGAAAKREYAFYARLNRLRVRQLLEASEIVSQAALLPHLLSCLNQPSDVAVIFYVLSDSRMMVYFEAREGDSLFFGIGVGKARLG